jgi:hypothetical protein
MFVYYNQDLLKREIRIKKHQDLMVVLRKLPTQWGPTPRTCYQCGRRILL